MSVRAEEPESKRFEVALKGGEQPRAGCKSTYEQYGLKEMVSETIHAVMAYCGTHRDRVRRSSMLLLDHINNSITGGFEEGGHLLPVVIYILPSVLA